MSSIDLIIPNHLKSLLSVFKFNTSCLSLSIWSAQKRNPKTSLLVSIKCSCDWCGCVVLIWRPVNLSMIYSWVREFLNDENRGLDILVEYLSFAQCAVMWVPLHTLVNHWCFQKLLGWAADPAAELTCVPWSWGARNACASKRGVNCTLVLGCPAVSEWSVFLDGCCVVQLSFIMQLDDSFCDKRLALSQAASLT